MVWRWALVVQALSAAAFEQLGTNQGCSILRAHGMLSADCSQKDYTDVPQNLNSRIEVLDVSGNRIRELTKDSLSKYTSLKLLYLGDNMIDIVDNGVFTPLSGLEVLDLSLNGLNRIPFDVLQLPSLRKLDFSWNRLILDNPDVYEGAPVSHSLKTLSLSKNKLKELPPLWMIPELEYLNVSENELQVIKITDLAPMCRLKELEFRQNLKLFKSENDRCACYLFKSWTEKRSISLNPSIPLNCAIMETDSCENSTELQEALKLHSICKIGVETFQRQAAIKKTWLWVGIAAAVILAGILAVAVFMYCRSSSRRRVCANNNNQMACDDVKKLPPDPSSSQLLQDL